MKIEFGTRIGNNPITIVQEVKNAEEFIQLAIQTLPHTPFIYLITDDEINHLYAAGTHTFYILDNYFNDYNEVVKKYDLPVYNPLEDDKATIIELRASYQSADAFEDYTVCRTTRGIAKNVIEKREEFLKVRNENKKIIETFDLKIRQEHFAKVDKQYEKELLKYALIHVKLVNFIDTEIKKEPTLEDSDKLRELCKEKFNFESAHYNDFEKTIPMFEKINNEKQVLLMQIRNGEFGKPELKEYPFENNTPEYRISMLSNRKYIALPETELIK